MNQVVWHGYPYRDAPAGVGTAGRDGGTWPGYHPWDIFGALSVNDEFGPREASWPDYKTVNDALARTQLVLRQGHSAVDLGVYYDGAANPATTTAQHFLGTASATSSAGYTYDYVAPAFLTGAVTVAPDGSFTDGAANEKALILNGQSTLSVANAQRLLALARQGLRIFVIGDAPSATPGVESGSGATRRRGQRPARAAVGDARRRPRPDMPAALTAAGIRPAATPATPTSALGLVRREAGGVSYEFVYNRSKTTVDQDLTLAGSGRPYRLNTWTGAIEPIAQYRADAGRRHRARAPRALRRNDHRAGQRRRHDRMRSASTGEILAAASSCAPTTTAATTRR